MSSISRFSAVTRRAALQGASLAALTGALAACSTADDALGSDSTGGASSTGGPVSAGAATSSATGQPTGATVPASAKASIAFTFTVSDGGDRVKNPYIAVWIEDASGAHVATVALWYQSGHGDQWLNSLTRWYGETNGDTSTSSATQVPGSYTVEWNAGDAKVAAGEYHVCIEASREHGPYELVRGKMTLGSSAATTTLAAQGELTKAVVTWTV